MTHYYYYYSSDMINTFEQLKKPHSTTMNNIFKKVKRIIVSVFPTLKLTPTTHKARRRIFSKNGDIWLYTRYHGNNCLGKRDLMMHHYRKHSIDWRDEFAHAQHSKDENDAYYNWNYRIYSYFRNVEPNIHLSVRTKAKKLEQMRVFHNLNMLLTSIPILRIKKQKTPKIIDTTRYWQKLYSLRFVSRILFGWNHNRTQRGVPRGSTQGRAACRIKNQNGMAWHGAEFRNFETARRWILKLCFWNKFFLFWFD